MPAAAPGAVPTDAREIRPSVFLKKFLRERFMVSIDNPKLLKGTTPFHQSRGISDVFPLNSRSFKGKKYIHNSTKINPSQLRLKAAWP